MDTFKGDAGSTAPSRVFLEVAGSESSVQLKNVHILSTETRWLHIPVFSDILSIQSVFQKVLSTDISGIARVKHVASESNVLIEVIARPASDGRIELKKAPEECHKVQL